MNEQYKRKQNQNINNQLESVQAINLIDQSTDIIDKMNNEINCQSNKIIDCSQGDDDNSENYYNENINKMSSKKRLNK